MYHDPPPNGESESRPATLPRHLPGASELSPYQQGQTLLAEIRRDITVIRRTYSLETPSDDDLDQLVRPEGDACSTKTALLALHVVLRRELAAQNSRLATAFDLGRMLADTVLLPDGAVPASLANEFDHFRLTNAYSWLDDLHSSLPAHASDTVSGSLKHWEEWVDENKGIVPVNVKESFHRTLHRQGDLWRRLLCGDKLAADLLNAADYKKAGDRVAKGYLGLIGGYLRSWWYVVALFLLAVGAIVWAVIEYAPAGASTTAGLITAAAGSLGVSWKTVASTLGRIAKNAEAPLWDAEVKEAMILAATRLPKQGADRMISDERSLA